MEVERSEVQGQPKTQSLICLVSPDKSCYLSFDSYEVNFNILMCLILDNIEKSKFNSFINNRIHSL